MVPYDQPQSDRYTPAAPGAPGWKVLPGFVLQALLVGNGAWLITDEARLFCCRSTSDLSVDGCSLLRDLPAGSRAAMSASLDAVVAHSSGTIAASCRDPCHCDWAAPGAALLGVVSDVAIVAGSSAYAAAANGLFVLSNASGPPLRIEALPAVPFSAVAIASAGDTLPYDVAAASADRLWLRPAAAGGGDGRSSPPKWRHEWAAGLLDGAQSSLAFGAGRLWAGGQRAHGGC